MPNAEYHDNPYTLFAIRAIKDEAVKETLQDLTALLDDPKITDYESAIKEYVQRKAAELLTPNN